MDESSRWLLIFVIDQVHTPFGFVDAWSLEWDRCMAEKGTKITRVEIKGLWGRYDLAWDLLPDVNILAGVNGSGKSTIITHVAALITTGRPFFNKKATEHLLVIFDNGQQISVDENHRQKAINSNWHDLNLGAVFFLVNTFDAIHDFRPNVREGILTELDWHISELQKSYLNYQLNLNKKLLEILKVKL
jgi:hypothetical protein